MFSRDLYLIPAEVMHHCKQYIYWFTAEKMDVAD